MGAEINSGRAGIFGGKRYNSGAMIAVFRVLLFASALLFAPAALAQGEDIRRVEKGIERLEEQGKRRDEKIEALTANMAELAKNMAVMAEKVTGLTERVSMLTQKVDAQGREFREEQNRQRDRMDNILYAIIGGFFVLAAAYVGVNRPWRKPPPAAPAADSGVSSDVSLPAQANPNIVIVTEDIVSAALARHFRENSSREITPKRVQ